MINPFLNPWNIYGILNKPNPSIYGSEIIGNNEYFISFMPPLFFPQYKITYAKIVEKMITEKLDFNTAHTAITGCSYISQFPNWFSNGQIDKTVNSMYDSIHIFFSIEEQLLKNINPASISHLQLLGCLHYLLNILQVYIHPIESFSTGKISPYNPFFTIFKNEDLLIHYQGISPLIESLFIPMSILTKGEFAKTTEYRELMSLMKLTLGTDKTTLTFSFDNASRQYGYKKYMDVNTAIGICRQIFKKYVVMKKTKNIDKIMSHLLNLNGFLTWSKYIYYPNTLNVKRFDTFHIWYPYIVSAALKEYPFNPVDLQIRGISTTEKEAKIIYILKTIFNHSKKSGASILRYSYEFEKKYLSISNNNKLFAK